jgi:hypothetical protein
MARNKRNKLTSEQVFKRAGGRRRYNRERQDAAAHRRSQVRCLLDLYGRDRRGTQARIARELRVSRSTICRDVEIVLLFDWAMKHPAKALRLFW